MVLHMLLGRNGGQGAGQGVCCCYSNSMSVCTKTAVEAKVGLQMQHRMLPPDIAGPDGAPMSDVA